MLVHPGPSKLRSLKPGGAWNVALKHTREGLIGPLVMVNHFAWVPGSLNGVPTLKLEHADKKDGS